MSEHKPITIEFKPSQRWYYERFQKIVSPFASEHFYKPVNNLSHSVRFARRALKLLYEDAAECFNFSKVELISYEHFLCRQYPRLFEANNHEWIDRNTYLFAKWFSRYWNLVYDHATALRGQTYEVMHRIFPLSNYDDFSRQLETEYLDSFISELEKLKELVDLSLQISKSNEVKAMKYYLLKDARQAIRPAEKSSFNSGFLIYKRGNYSIDLNYYEVMEHQKHSCEYFLKGNVYVKWIETTEPFGFEIETKEIHWNLNGLQS